MSNTESINFAQNAAITYDARIINLVPGYTAQQETSAAILGTLLPGKASILVVGAGTGTELIQFAQTNPNWQFVAIDPAAEMLALAQQRVIQANLDERIELQTCALSAYQPGQQHDAAISLLVTHFLPDNGEKAQFFCDISRCLAPNAPFLASEYSTWSSPLAMQAYQQWSKNLGKSDEEIELMTKRISGSFHPVDIKRRLQLLDDAGFDQAQIFFQALDFHAYLAQKKT
ncbi:MAG: class I SAM-dependent methyltransferase [Pseudomonadota bacterium]